MVLTIDFVGETLEYLNGELLRVSIVTCHLNSWFVDNSMLSSQQKSCNATIEMLPNNLCNYDKYNL